MRSDRKKSSPLQPVTMRDVARHAGVSLATVSRALDGSALVSRDTVLRVQKAVAELSFVPNLSARTLKYGQSNAIGVIVPDLSNPFFSEFLREFEAITSSNRQAVLLANSETNSTGTSTSVKQMLMRAVDGLVIMPSLDEFESYQMLTQRRVPTVAVDSRRVGPHFSDVSFMHEEGMLQSVGYLHDMGHKRIAFIGGSEGIAISQIRADAFCAALKKHIVPIRPEYLRSGNYRADGGEREMRTLLSLREPPTAVVAINDLSAVGALRACRALGIRVPEEISIIGFDGIELGEFLFPSLTTMNVPRKQFAHACHRAIEDLRTVPGSKGQQVYVPVELVVRQSTGRAPQTARRKLRS